MDFDKPKVYGDTSITDGLVLRELGLSLGFFLWMQCLASSETDVLCCDFFVVTQAVEDAIFAMLVLTSMFKLMPGQ